MKAVPAAHNMTHELFVIQFDGHAKSGYRRLAEALKAALRLRHTRRGPNKNRPGRINGSASKMPRK
jgi:hypothetical protein